MMCKEKACRGYVNLHLLPTSAQPKYQTSVKNTQQQKYPQHSYIV